MLILTKITNNMDGFWIFPGIILTAVGFYAIFTFGFNVQTVFFTVGGMVSLIYGAYAAMHMDNDWTLLITAAMIFEKSTFQ